MLSQSESNTNAEEEGALLEEIKIDLCEIALSQLKVIQLIEYLNKHLCVINKAGKAAQVTSIISSSIFAVSTSFFVLDTEKGWLLSFSIMSGLITVISSISALDYCINSRNGMITSGTLRLPDYDTKIAESVNLIKEYGISIRDESNPFSILSGLKRVEHFIKKYEGTVPQRKKAIQSSLVPTLFNSVKRGTAGYSICEDIFECAGLSKVNNMSL